MSVPAEPVNQEPSFLFAEKKLSLPPLSVLPNVAPVACFIGYFALSKKITPGQHNAQMVAFAEGKWWGSKPFEVIVPD